MGYRSVVVLVFYASLVTGLVALIAEFSATIARQAPNVLAFAEDPDQPASRVEHGLEVQARATEWQPVSHVAEIRAVEPPEVSAVTLASAMDAAEGADLPGQELQQELHTQPPTKPKAKPVKPRVAGWIRRVARPPVHRREHIAESTARLIERRLRAEM